MLKGPFVHRLLLAGYRHCSPRWGPGPCTTDASRAASSASSTRGDGSKAWTSCGKSSTSSLLQSASQLPVGEAPDGDKDKWLKTETLETVWTNQTYSQCHTGIFLTEIGKIHLVNFPHPTECVFLFYFEMWEFHRMFKADAMLNFLLLRLCQICGLAVFTSW